MIIREHRPEDFERLFQIDQSVFGGRLMAAIEEWLAAQEVRVVALETPADKNGARQFYEKHGYQLGGRVRGYYHGRLDAFSMVKRLGADQSPAP